jgi:hypothetical protein
MNRTRMLSAAAGLLLPLVVAGSTVYAQQNQNGNGQGQNGNGQGQNGNGQGQNGKFTLSSTPELDSVLLFGTGLAGLAGYALVRVRASRGRRNSP